MNINYKVVPCQCSAHIADMALLRVSLAPHVQGQVTRSTPANNPTGTTSKFSSHKGCSGEQLPWAVTNVPIQQRTSPTLLRLLKAEVRRSLTVREQRHHKGTTGRVRTGDHRYQLQTWKWHPGLCCRARVPSKKCYARSFNRVSCSGLACAT